MEMKALIKYTKVSPKKLREISHALVGLKTTVALDRLSLLTQKSARLLYKAVKSAQMNAVNNMKVSVESLTIKTIQTGKGPFLKRWNPVSRGMAHAIKKRTSHITVIVESKEQQKVLEGKKEIQNTKPEVQSSNIKDQKTDKKSKTTQSVELLEEKKGKGK